MAWQFKREEAEFQILPEGIYRVRVKSAEKAISQSGNDMLALQFEVSGSNAILYHYITFIDDKPEITNRMLTQFFDSFKDIEEGDFKLANWIGKVGAAKVKHDEWNGKEKAVLHYFIKADKQGDLPPWKEPEKSSESGSNGNGNGFVEVSDKEVEDLGFF
jgi:hypothetical protein